VFLERSSRRLDHAQGGTKALDSHRGVIRRSHRARCYVLCSSSPLGPLCPTQVDESRQTTPHDEPPVAHRRGPTAACSRVTSFPSAAPKSPASRKSRCMSMITRADLLRSIVSGVGSASRVAVDMGELSGCRIVFRARGHSRPVRRRKYACRAWRPGGDFPNPSKETLNERSRYLEFSQVDNLVGAPRFELGTPSLPDWCANRAALRSVMRRTIGAGMGRGNGPCGWSSSAERAACRASAPA
jgi:hypothetical protein